MADAQEAVELHEKLVKVIADFWEERGVKGGTYASVTATIVALSEVHGSIAAILLDMGTPLEKVKQTVTEDLMEVIDRRVAKNTHAAHGGLN